MTKFSRTVSYVTVLVTGLSISACSSMSQDGLYQTDLGGSLSQMWSNVFTGELRRAPEPEYSFGGTDATLNTPLLLSRVNRQAAFAKRQVVQTARHDPAFYNDIGPIAHTADSRLSPQNPWSRRSTETTYPQNYEDFVPQKSAALTPLIANQTVRPPRSQPVYAAPTLEREAYPLSQPSKIASYETFKTQSVEPLPQESNNNLSYVKMGGGSQISDWQGCERETGEAFIRATNSYVIASDFDSCMREKGYKPEAEAELELAGSAN